MTPEELAATARTVLAGYAEWDTTRADLSERENMGTAGASEWERSDEAGLEYARALADLLQKAVDSIGEYEAAIRNITRSWEGGDLATAVNQAAGLLPRDTKGTPAHG